MTRSDREAAGLPPGRCLAVVVAGGDVAARDRLDAAWPGWDDGLELVIAADGGLEHARALGLHPDLLVGDLDSLPADAVAAAEADGVAVLRARPDKDESDTELALLEAVRRAPERIIVLGAFGGQRLDHALANVWLLAHPALAGRDIVLLDERTRVSLVAAPGADGAAVTTALPGRTGAIVSLLPLAGVVEGITTHGLLYALRDEPLVPGPARGLSNVRTRDDARVVVRRGLLLVVEAAPAPGAAEGARTAGGLSSAP
ncbi:MAG: thiamine diphosphokinase [Chloroflexota bacterium]